MYVHVFYVFTCVSLFVSVGVLSYVWVCVSNAPLSVFGCVRVGEGVCVCGCAHVWVCACG